MSWSNGNLRWRIPFVSVGGKSCRIDIYKRGYSGSTYDVLSISEPGAACCGAEVPFYYEDDSDDDLLSVIRIKTGYIQLIELTAGGVDELIPASCTDHYIEFYYNNKLDFTGYIQPGSYASGWVPCPRERQLMVMSPLGVFGTKRLAVPAKPCWKTLGSVLQEVCEGMGSGISEVLFPAVELNYRVNSLAYCPYNEAHTYRSTIDNLYTPMSYEEFIESLCHCFGLLVHDQPGLLAFTRVDEEGTYRIYDVSTLSSLNPSYRSECRGDAVSWMSHTVMSDAGREWTVQPLKSIVLNYGGAKDISVGIPLNHMKTGYIQDTQTEACVTMNPKTDEFVSERSFLTLGAAGVNAGAFGGIDDELNEGVLIRLDAAMKSYDHLFTWTIHEQLLSWGLLRLRWKWGDSLDALDTAEVDAFRFGLRITCGDYKLITDETYSVTGRHRWSTAQGTSVWRTVNADNEGMVEIYIPAQPLRDEPIVIQLMDDTLKQDYYYFLEMELTTAGNRYGQYTVENGGSLTRTIEHDNGARRYGEIDLPFHLGCLTSNMLTKQGGDLAPIGDVTDYGYLFRKQRHLEVDLNMQLGEARYACYHRLTESGTTLWRLIGYGFTPSEDSYHLNFQTCEALQ